MSSKAMLDGDRVTDIASNRQAQGQYDEDVVQTRCPGEKASCVESHGYSDRSQGRESPCACIIVSASIEV